jgi:hypothetical protein
MKDGLRKQFVRFSLIIVILSTASFSLVIAEEKNDKSENRSQTVTVTVERATLNQGYYVEPTQVEISSGDTVASVLNKVIGDNTVWNGDRLTGINGAQAAGISIPGCLSDMEPNENNEAAPTTDSARVIGCQSSACLAEKDYSTTSTWMCMVNNELLGNTMKNVAVNSGDVIRIQFSLWGNGADLGQTLSGTIPAIAVADKDALIKLIGVVNSSPDYDQYLKNSEFISKYQEAVSVAQAIDSTQSMVDGASNELQQAIPAVLESITCENATLEISVNQIRSVPIKTEPAIGNEGVSWVSSDPSIAIVDESGNVTGVSPGVAVITAAALSGNASANCSVTVKAIPITEIQLSMEQLLIEAGEACQLDVRCFPENATETGALYWASSDEAIASVTSSGVVAGRNIGTAVISVQTESGIKAEAQVTVASTEDLAVRMTSRINSLPKKGTLVLADASAIDEVKQEYDSLSEKVRALIDQNTVNSLNERLEQIEVLKLNQEKAAGVVALIDALPDSSQLSLADEEKVKIARSTYETGLNDEQKALIDKDVINKLSDCEKKLQKIKKENQDSAKNIMAAISDLPLPNNIALTDGTEIIAARVGYDKLTEDQKKLVTNYDVLVSTEDVLGRLITATVDASTRVENINLDSAETTEFVEACSVYDTMTAVQQGIISADTKDKMQKIQAAIKNITGVSNGVCVDVPWHVVVKAREIGSADAIFKTISKNVLNYNATLTDSKLLKLYEISYQDLYTHRSSYEIKVGEAFSVSLPEISDGANYLNLKLWNVSDTGAVLPPTRIDPVSGSNRMEAKTVKAQYLGITGDNATQSLSTAAISDASLSPDLNSAYNDTAAYMLVAAAQPTIQSGLWETICFARSGYAVPAGYYDLYYSNVLAEVQEGKGAISGDRTNTDYSKTIISLAAIGKDPANVGGYNLLTKLANFDKIKRGGMMAYVWALIALDSKDYEIPATDTGTQTTRDLLIKTILDREVVTSSGVRGGFSLYSEAADAAPDTDVTAMTLQALAKYKDRADVKPVVERALTVLSSLQNDNGSYGTFGAPETSESTSQVILALTSLGIDPGTDNRFIKGNNWLLSDLMSYHVSSGGFMHIKPGGASNGGAEPGALNGMASYQASQAMIAYNRFKQGKTWIFRMTDGFSPVTDNNTKIDDLVNEYNKRFGKSGTSTATVTGTTVVATGSSGGGTSTGAAAATAASAKGGGTTATETAFTPWSFDAPYTAKTESSEVVDTDAQKDMIYRNNVFFLSAFGIGIAAVVVILTIVNKKNKRRQKSTSR